MNNSGTALFELLDAQKETREREPPRPKKLDLEHKGRRPPVPFLTSRRTVCGDPKY